MKTKGIDLRTECSLSSLFYVFYLVILCQLSTSKVLKYRGVDVIRTFLTGFIVRITHSRRVKIFGVNLKFYSYDRIIFHTRSHISNIIFDFLVSSQTIFLPDHLAWVKFHERVEFIKELILWFPLKTRPDYPNIPCGWSWTVYTDQKTNSPKVICNSPIATSRRAKNYSHFGVDSRGLKLWNEEFRSQIREHYQSSLVDISGWLG